MQSRRVVITGLGPVTCFGVGAEPLWNALVEGRTGIRRIGRFNPDGFDCRYAAELDDEQFNIKKIVPKSYRKATKVMCRDIELAVAAADAAVRDAHLTTKATDPDAEPTYAPHRVGCQIGAGLIAADVDELTAALVSSRTEENGVDLADWGGGGMQNLTPLWLLKYLPNMLACHVTIIHDCHGPSNTITCCEASSGLSLGESVRVIARGGADVCLTGGAEFKINPMAMFRQSCARRLAAPANDEEAARAVRPFAPDASGTLLGEGGGILVLEALETAEQRSATPLAEVIGFASTQSLCRYTISFDFDPEDTAMADAMELAMKQAGISPEQVDAIVPFGSGIANVDQAEATAIRSIFGERAASIPIITTTPFTGNCNAGNGAVALSAAVLSLMHQKLPARLNSQGADGLDADAREARDAELKHILAFSTSQGGQNAAIVMKRWES